MIIEFKLLQAGDESIHDHITPDLFDDPIQPERLKEFLEDSRHHLIVALDDKIVVGFVSAVHYIHPDKAHPELWINEVSVAEAYQKRGIGKAMMQKTLELGKQLGCKEAWVLTERRNTAAIKLYGANGGKEDALYTVMFSFDLE